MKQDEISWKQDDTDELYRFAGDDAANTWKVIIVDDEIEMHRATKKALLSFSFCGKSLQFLSAFTKTEAKQLICQHPDTSVILLDVMMEGEKAGLEIVEYIRHELNNTFVRIILRTGQPQEAPEETVIREYDINDYREKTDLTAAKLYTAIMTALRSYRDIMLIDSNKKALERVIASSIHLMNTKSMHKLADQVLGELITILSLNADRNREEIAGFIATKDKHKDFYILAATAKYSDIVGQSIIQHFSACSLELFRKGHFLEKEYSKFFCSQHGHESFIYIEGLQNIDDWEVKLLDILMMNVQVAIDNMHLNQEIEETQKEIIFTLGEFSEARSKETSNHVRRVAEYSKLLALKYGLTEEEAELLRLASPMHDVGKLGITDVILNKPGRLTEEEFKVIQSHGVLGYEILKNSNRRIMQAGAIIALQHHEKFNGQGYPHGLKGEEIHIYGRITAIADVFDALGSERVYKKAWPIDQILTYFAKEKGQHFDPVLVDIFFAYLPLFLEIQQKFEDRFSIGA